MTQDNAGALPELDLDYQLRSGPTRAMPSVLKARIMTQPARMRPDLARAVRIISMNF